MEVLLAVGVVMLIAVVDAVRLELRERRLDREVDQKIAAWERRRRNMDRGLN